MLDVIELSIQVCNKRFTKSELDDYMYSVGYMKAFKGSRGNSAFDRNGNVRYVSKRTLQEEVLLQVKYDTCYRKPIFVRNVFKVPSYLIRNKVSLDDILNKFKTSYITYDHSMRRDGYYSNDHEGRSVYREEYMYTDKDNGTKEFHRSKEDSDQDGRWHTMHREGDVVFIGADGVANKYYKKSSYKFEKYLDRVPFDIMYKGKAFTLFKSPEDFETKYALQFNNQEQDIGVEYVKSGYSYDLIKYNEDTVEYIKVRYTDNGDYTRYEVRSRKFDKYFTHFGACEVFNGKTPYGVSIDKDTDLNECFDSIKKYFGIKGEPTLYPIEGSLTMYPIEGNIVKCYSGSTEGNCFKMYYRDPYDLKYKFISHTYYGYDVYTFSEDISTYLNKLKELEG